MHILAPAENVADLVAEFFPGTMPGFASAKGSSRAVRRYLRRLAARMGAYRAPETWRTYVHPWRKAWRWCRKQLLTELRNERTARRRRGRALRRRKVVTVQVLAERPHVAIAYAEKLAEESTGKTVVATACTAINFAMHVNGQPAIMNSFPAKLLKEAMKRERGGAVRKMHELRRHELAAVVRKWGFGSGAGWRRQVALTMGLGRALLGRFSDVAMLRIDGIIFMPEGVLFCVARRKNQQYRRSWLPLADSGKKHSLVRLLRLHMRDLGCTVPRPTPRGARVVGGRTRVCRYLLRPMQRTGTSTHAMRREYVLGTGRVPMTMHKGTGYNPMLAMCRRALRECCGYTKAQAQGFGTQSWRRGGDTALFEGNVPQEQRQLLGMWRTPSVELSYIGFTARQHMAWARGSAL